MNKGDGVFSLMSISSISLFSVREYPGGSHNDSTTLLSN